jgi:hypothetical protein
MTLYGQVRSRLLLVLLTLHYRLVPVVIFLDEAIQVLTMSDAEPGSHAAPPDSISLNLQAAHKACLTN